MRTGIIQMAAVDSVSANLATANRLMERTMAEERPDWLLLPEHFHWAGGGNAQRLAAGENLKDGPAYSFCQDFARNHRVWVHAGSIFERSADGSRIYNTTVVFDRDGVEQARYRKVHLFDIIGPDGTRYGESDVVDSGGDVVVYDMEGLKIGCTICFDLRFPELFQALVAKGADVIAVPAAFTLQTGKDHWEPLLRARAIETQCYIAASGMHGTVAIEGHQHTTYGHSALIDPWGHIVGMASDGDGIVAGTVRPELIAKVRAGIPLALHRQIRRNRLSGE